MISPDTASIFQYVGDGGPLPLCPTLARPDVPITSLNSGSYMSPSGFCNIEIVEPRDPFVLRDTHAYTVIPSPVDVAHSPFWPRGAKETTAPSTFRFCQL